MSAISHKLGLALINSSSHLAVHSFIFLCFCFQICPLFCLQLDRYQQKVLKRENSIAVLCKTKVARMLFIIVTAFILLHIPFTVVVFVRQTLLQNAIMNQAEGAFYMLNCVSHYFLYLNAAINPVIYGLTNDGFRRAYHQTPILPRFKTVKTTSKVNSMHAMDVCVCVWCQLTGIYCGGTLNRILFKSNIHSRTCIGWLLFFFIHRLHSTSFVGGFNEKTKYENTANRVSFNAGN